VESYSVYTNNITASAMRGFGVTQAAVAHEGQMDELAKSLGINPLRFRLMNALENGLSTATGQVFHEGVGIKACLEKLKEAVQADSELSRCWKDPL
jgi:CO/xanthine dehydrogenase Mo-binding subunit